ncbi:MAG TPA: rod shape-determining protein RodA [Gammaproteobacteria bacterium]|nr:rod shape-determining protein RodA [Gammaproteobacteria bacterium]
MSTLLDSHREDASRRDWQHILHLDAALLFGLVALSTLGLFVLYSSAGGDENLLMRQVIRLGLAFSTMAVIAQLRPQWLQRWTPWLYGSGLLLLIAVLVAGDVGKGAQRWLDLGFVRFQPSEMMKLAVPMMVAWYLSDKRLPPTGGRLLIAGALIIVPVMLIARQPDLGTSLLIGSAGFFALFLAGLSWRLLGGLSLLAAAGAPLLWHFMHDYQRQRVITFLDPEQDPLGAGYHIIQSKIAIGSGGLFGKGWLNGTQAHLEFLPERSTDFIFAVLGEEFGLVGIGVLLLVYSFIIFRSLYIATQAQDTFGRLLGGSLAMTFFIYIIVNTGMVTGLLPVVGLPLPMVSYGGTSMVTLMAGFGILMSIHTHRKLLPT